MTARGGAGPLAGCCAHEFLLSLAAFAPACGSDPVPEKRGPARVCTAGETEACYSGPAGTEGIGICAAGVRRCLADGSGFEPSCTAEVTPRAEDCDTPEDDDCDGAVNDGCACEPGASVACYPGPDGTDGVGQCKSGTAICNADGTSLGACMDFVLPSAESCATPDDDDCDGEVNEGCACEPGTTAPCYSGPAETLGVGICAGGTTTCLPSGEGWGPCEGEVLPAAQDDCATPDDENCDGIANEPASGCVCEPGAVEACYDGPAMTEGVGTCASGTHTCLPSGHGYGDCAGEVLPAAEDDCATPEDENCDGVANEPASGCVCAPGASEACYDGPPGTEGVGVCAGGVRTCNAGGDGFGACMGETIPTADTCNGIDDDCNGTTDDLGCGGAALWSKSFGTPNNEEASAVAVDAATGDVVIVGQFTGTVDFGGGPRTAVGQSDVFVARYSPAGAHLWSKTFGGSGYDGGWTVAVDGTGAVVVGGHVYGTVDFGGGPIVSAGDRAFVAKLSVSGDYEWAKLFGTSNGTSARSVAVDSSDDVVVTGIVVTGPTKTTDFGGGPIANQGLDDIFLLELAPDGSHLWSKIFGGTQLDQGYGVATDAAGHVVMTGRVSGQVDLGGGAVDGASMELVVAKYDATGGYLWSKRFTGGTTQASQPSEVAVDAVGNVLLSSIAAGTIDVGGGPLTVNGIMWDAFVAKYTPDGAHLWSLLHDNPSGQIGHALAVDGAGDVLLAGNLESSPQPVFVTKYTASGATLWSHVYTGAGNVAVGGIAVAPGGDIALCGMFRTSIDFGAGPLTGAGNDDAFVTLLPP